MTRDVCTGPFFAQLCFGRGTSNTSEIDRTRAAKSSRLRERPIRCTAACSICSTRRAISCATVSRAEYFRHTASSLIRRASVRHKLSPRECLVGFSFETRKHALYLMECNIDSNALSIANGVCVGKQSNGPVKIIMCFLEQIYLVVPISRSCFYNEIADDVFRNLHFFGGFHKFPIFRSVFVADFVERGLRYIQSTLSAGYLHGSTIGKCRHHANLVEGAIHGAFQGLDRLVSCSLCLPDTLPERFGVCSYRALHVTERAYCGSMRKLKLRSCASRRQLCGLEILRCADLMIFARVRKGCNHCTHCADRNNDIDENSGEVQEVFRRTVRASYCSSGACDGQKSKCDQKCDKRDVNDLPCSLHDFPVSIWGWIVA